MKVIDAIRTALELSDRATTSLLEDMRTQPTPRGGNHPFWVLGRIALSRRAWRTVRDALSVALGRPRQGAAS